MKENIIKVFSIKNNNTGNSSQRIEIVDFLRGGAMVLVLLHHSGFPLGDYILAFHMPFFFILSGFFEKIRGVSASGLPFKAYVLKRFKRLIIPYIAFELINLVIWYIRCLVVQETIPVFSSLLSIVLCYNTKEYTGLCGRLWFLPCMFVSNILFWIISRFIKTRVGMASVGCILFFVSWITSRVIPFRLPFTIDTAMMATAFILIGYIFSDVISYLLSHGHIGVDIILAVFMGGMLFSAYRTEMTQMWMFVNRYGNYILSVAAALGGSIAYIIIAKYLYCLFVRIPFLKEIVLWYSYNSLATFPVHLQIKCLALLTGLSLFSYWWVMFILMFILNIPIVNFVSNYLPCLLGQKKERVCNFELRWNY